MEFSYRNRERIDTILSHRCDYKVDQKGRLVKKKKPIKSSVCTISSPPNRECEGISPKDHTFYREDMECYWKMYGELDSLLKRVGL